MSINSKKTRILITVMTYPHPSKKYEELICTAGITPEGEWVRLYPIDYRYRPSKQQFQKYQWIDISLEEQGDKGDIRKESRKPDLNSIQKVGEKLSTSNGWEERRKIIDPMPHHTLKELKALYDQDQTSLGIIKPSRILDIEIEETEAQWAPKWQEHAKQLRLFGPPPKTLHKIPYKFRYVFECEDSQEPHKCLITDWELGVLYLKEEERLDSKEAAARSVKKKFLDELCGQNKDTRFFMGTTYPYNQWIVIGVFWPPVLEKKPRTLFYER